MSKWKMRGQDQDSHPEEGRRGDREETEMSTWETKEAEPGLAHWRGGRRRHEYMGNEGGKARIHILEERRQRNEHMGSERDGTKAH